MPFSESWYFGAPWQFAFLERVRAPRLSWKTVLDNQASMRSSTERNEEGMSWEEMGDNTFRWGFEPMFIELDCYSCTESANVITEIVSSWKARCVTTMKHILVNKLNWPIWMLYCNMILTILNKEMTFIWVEW